MNLNMNGVQELSEDDGKLVIHSAEEPFEWKNPPIRRFRSPNLRSPGTGKHRHSVR